MSERKPEMYSDKEYLTTGEAADICAVTPNAVLKWVRAGKIPASRTPGGHHRIPRAAINKILEGEQTELTTERIEGEPFQYCWEFNARGGKIQEGCSQCIVYRSRSGRCFEMARLPVEAGHSRLFCQKSCEECEYYEMIKDRRANVMIITNQSDVRMELEENSLRYNLNFKLSDCEYKCSMLIESFRPDYIVLDCSLGPERSRDLINHLNEDPRIPFARLVLVGDKDSFPDGCDRMVFAFIRRPLKIAVLQNLIEGLRDGSAGKLETN